MMIRHFNTTLPALLSLLLFFGVSCTQSSPEDRQAAFERTILKGVGLSNIVDWARAQLKTNTEGVLPVSAYPASFARHKPIRVYTINGGKAGGRYVSIYFKYGPEVEGMMIGDPDFKASGFRYRSQITNGVFYFLDAN
jgi:hypothetical protein